MKHLIPTYIQEQLQQQQRHGQLRAYTLFIDLSGFTALTEDLMEEGVRGAEELSNILNEIFGPLVHLVYSRGGFIPYFAGDSFTAIFPDPSPHNNAIELVRTAAMARDYFRSRENRFGQYTFGIKFGLGYGKIDWGIVGEKLKAFYFRGPAIDQAAYSQTKASDGDIVVSSAVRNLLGDRPFRTEEAGDAAFRVFGTINVENAQHRPVDLPDPDGDIGQQFLPKEVVSYQQQGEFRTVVSVFVSFDGVENHEQLDQFATVVLNQIREFSGYFKEIDYGDKGGVLACFFGAPVSFENNIGRALEFLITLRETLLPLRKSMNLSLRAGMTVGTAFTGIVGGTERCQYACVGNRVNLAARIMTFADWEEILVDGEIHKNRFFRFQHKGDIKYKGIAENIPTFKLLGRNFDDKPAYSSEMVEREEELRQLTDFAQPIFEGRSAGIAYIYGEAGIGKSRLSYELRLELNHDNSIQWHVGPIDQILRKPFNPFIHFLRNYFEQSPDSTDELGRAQFETHFNQLVQRLQERGDEKALRSLRELQRTQTILAALIGIDYTNSLWSQLDAKGRYENALAAIVNLLLGESLVQPLVLELEDIHWIDENSLELVRELVRRMDSYPIFVLATSRYTDSGGKPILIQPVEMDQRQLPLLSIELTSLPDRAVRVFAEESLDGPISDEFYQLLLRTTNSNPFYLEQVLEYFTESQLVELEDGCWQIKDENIQLSGSINSILTARIDRLSRLVQETVKAAAVIGREFEVSILSEVMKQQRLFQQQDETENLLHEQIKTAEDGQIWSAINELRYIFRHSLLREAVYSMQLRTRLQELHASIAKAIERLFADHIEERYVDLVFHYEQAGDFDKTCEYLRKAADYARNNFQNQQALEFYERLLQKLGRQVDIFDEIKTHIKRGKVLELIGNWEEAQKSYERSLRQAKKSRDVLLIGQANNSLGQLLMLRGDYPAALEYFQTAARLFESIDDSVGIAKTYGNLGSLHFRYAEYDEAQEYFEKSLNTGYAQASTSNSAQIVSSLGLTYMNRGEFTKGIEVIRKQLDLHRTRQDKQGLAILYTNLGIVFYEKGDYEDALNIVTKGLNLAEELGNKQLIAIATGMIGSVYQHQGNYERAMEFFERDLRICRELGDKQGISIALGLIGELHSVQGNFAKAIDYLQKTLVLSEELGYRKGIAKAINTLGDVFYFTQQFDRSISFYDRAIDMAREIDNRLVLGFSLVEKGIALLALEDLVSLESVQREALEIAEELGNPDLSAEARLLNVRYLHARGNNEEALKHLGEIAQQAGWEPFQQAGIAYEYFRIIPEEARYREMATELYLKLYQQTPKFLYRKRLQQLGLNLEGKDESADFLLAKESPVVDQLDKPEDQEM